MKKLLAGLSFTIFLITGLYSQKVSEIGVLGGTSFYMGDLNSSKLFYAPSLAYGGFFKYNLNPRYAVRTGFNLLRLRGNGELHNTEYREFNTSLLDYNVSFEINFLPYNPNSPKENFTPFVYSGIGYSRVTATNREAASHVSLPFGTGCKLNITDELDVGFEWSFRKTFSDLADGQNIHNVGYEDTELKSVIHNNDWYSFFGLFITFKFINFGEKCPAYY